jgi:hypothetical protein
MTNVSYRQRSYANCQQCWKPMYSWNSSRVPRFAPLKPAAGTVLVRDIITKTDLK